MVAEWHGRRAGEMFVRCIYDPHHFGMPGLPWTTDSVKKHRLAALLGRLRVGAPAAGAARMLQWEDSLLDFFRVNHMANSSVYVTALGILKTEDLAHFSDKDLRSLRLSPSELLEVQNCVLYVKLELGHWRWETAMSLLRMCRSDLLFTTDEIGGPEWNDILRKVGFDCSSPPDKRSRVPEANRVAVLDALQSLVERVNKQK
jgi:hypothetical protein